LDKGLVQLIWHGVGDGKEECCSPQLSGLGLERPLGAIGRLVCDRLQTDQNWILISIPLCANKALTISTRIMWFC